MGYMQAKKTPACTDMMMLPVAVRVCGNYGQYDEGIGICSTDGKDVVSMQLWF